MSGFPNYIRTTYVLMAGEDKYVTDERGRLRVWFYRSVALKDAKRLERILGMKFRVVAYPEAIIAKPIPPAYRVVI